MRASAIASPRSMIVGRQASVADIRVDHKSVSRRHTALYYLNVSHGSNSNGADHGAVLVVQDLGGKHGTYVNNKRLEKNGKVQLPLNGIDSLTKHTIRFGNAPLICNAEINAIESTQQQDLQKPEMDNPMQQKELAKLHSQHNLDEGIKSVSVSDVNNGVMISDEKALPANNNTSTDVASSRETREAQIAAMIASFDTKPVYKQYIQPNEENNDTPGNTTKITNNLSQSESNSNTNIQAKNNDNEYNLPITSSIILSPGSDSFTSSDGTNTPLQSKSSVAALCFEPSGSRLVAGHRDGSIRFYDFHGMKPATSSADSSSQITYPPFRIVDSDNDPLDQTGRHVLTAINPSPTGSQWIVGTTSSQPKVVDREGRATLFHFWKGDSYVTDASKTTGHTAGVTGVAFHPLVKDVCWTCGLDGSIRQWDVSGRGKTQFGKLVCQKVLAKCKNEKGQRTQIVSCIGVHPSGRKLVVGTSCGSIQVWNCFGNMVSSRPLGAVYSAHGGSKPVTFVTFSNTGEKISR